MSALLAALIGIIAAFGVIMLLVLTLSMLARDARPLPVRVARWSGHRAIAFFNHPPQVWAGP